LGVYGDERGERLTRRRKRGAATVVEGYDRAAVERGDPSIPADQLAGAKSHFALLDVIEAWFPQSKLKLVEFGVHTTVRMPESECVANRISLAQHTRGPQLGAWFQGRERDAISNFRDHFHKANASWLRIARPLRALYDEKALTDERVEGGTLTEILSRLDIFSMKRPRTFWTQLSKRLQAVPIVSVGEPS
jgi:hypothetical protein